MRSISDNLLLAAAGAAGGGLDPDAESYVSAVESADGQALESATVTAVNDFIVGIKSDGDWSKIDQLCIYGVARTLAGVAVAVKGLNPSLVGFSLADQNRKTGLIGGSGKGVNSNVRVDTTYSPNNASFGCYVTERGNGGVLLGTYISSGTTRISVDQNGGLYNIGANWCPTGSVVSYTPGHTILANYWQGLSSNSTTGYIARLNGTDRTVSETQDASFAPYKFAFLSGNSSYGGTGFTVWASNPSRILVSAIGTYMSFSNIESRSAQLELDLNSAIL